MAETILKVEGAGFSYKKGKPLFSDVNFELHQGEIFTILGPNGAGKSTLLSCISGYFPLSSGEVSVGGRGIREYSSRELARWIGVVPQMQAKTYDFSVREYIAMGRAPYLGFGKSPSRTDYALVDQVMEELGISRLADQFYTRISGGECQQVLIARVLVQQSRIILLDEPVNHLDYGNQIRILRLLKKLAGRDYGIILTTHMPDHALMLGGTVAVLDRQGRLEVDKSGRLLGEEYLYELYGERICRTYVEKAGREACLPYPLQRRESARQTVQEGQGDGIMLTDAGRSVQ
ncbi:MAG: ABC transporter ATP-binding protein [Eubacteriales bacterium]|nr:ABC transporter ATP-binding protein [Eubacteriales bacterium]